MDDSSASAAVIRNANGFIIREFDSPNGQWATKTEYRKHRSSSGKKPALAGP
jgi:hypothetical protein